MFEFFQQVSDFITSGIYELLTEFTAFITIKLVTWWFKVKIALIVFFSDVAQQILIQLNISQAINTAWVQLDSQMLAVLTYFRIPEALNMMLNAHITRFVMRIWGV